MKISGKRDYSVDLESVAMTDIILNMFIFFFISFSLLYTFKADRMQKLKVNVPKTKENQSEQSKQVSVVIDKDGVVYLDKKAVTFDELTEEIDSLREKKMDVKVLLQADEESQFKYSAKALGVLDGAGVEQINIGVRED